ncbi:hypothetical protein D3C80_1699440 [compost metagenome]
MIAGVFIHLVAYGIPVAIIVSVVIRPGPDYCTILQRIAGQSSKASYSNAGFTGDCQYILGQLHQLRVIIRDMVGRCDPALNIRYNVFHCITCVFILFQAFRQLEPVLKQSIQQIIAV